MWENQGTVWFWIILLNYAQLGGPHRSIFRDGRKHTQGHQSTQRNSSEFYHYKSRKSGNLGPSDPSRCIMFFLACFKSARRGNTHLGLWIAICHLICRQWDWNLICDREEWGKNERCKCWGWAADYFQGRDKQIGNLLIRGGTGKQSECVAIHINGFVQHRMIWSIRTVCDCLYVNMVLSANWVPQFRRVIIIFHRSAIRPLGSQERSANAILNEVLDNIHKLEVVLYT